MKDHIYQNVTSVTKLLYQKYFEEALDSVNVENFTNQALGKSFDKNMLEHDYKLIEKIVNNAKKKDSLSPVVLQIMLEQYFWADVYIREMDKDKWIYRVMNRKDKDFFPDSIIVYKNIFSDESND